MKTIRPGDVPVPAMHQLLLGTVSPRPIAFASTVDKDGNVNLSPFSFFNVFSANPPILVFSPSRRGTNNTTKDTYNNVLEVPEVTINVVNYAMVQQMSLASTEYPTGVNEFLKSGFTPVESELVKPPRVGEAPAAFECKVIEVKPLGDKGGAGNLVICEVLQVHVDENLYIDGKIDPYKIDHVARMGTNYYCRAQGDAIFEVAKPLTTLGIGVDAIPQSIRHSKVLTGNDLGILGNVEKLPSDAEVEEFASEPEVHAILEDSENEPDNLQEELHKLAAKYIADGNPVGAWKVLLQEY